MCCFLSNERLGLKSKILLGLVSLHDHRAEKYPQQSHVAQDARTATRTQEHMVACMTKRMAMGYTEPYHAAGGSARHRRISVCLPEASLSISRPLQADHRIADVNNAMYVPRR